MTDNNSDKELHSGIVEIPDVREQLDIPENAEIHQMILREKDGEILVEWLEESE